MKPMRRIAYGDMILYVIQTIYIEDIIRSVINMMTHVYQHKDTCLST